MTETLITTLERAETPTREHWLALYKALGICPEDAYFPSAYDNFAVWETPIDDGEGKLGGFESSAIELPMDGGIPAELLAEVPPGWQWTVGTHADPGPMFSGHVEGTERQRRWRMSVLCRLLQRAACFTWYRNPPCKGG